MLEKEVAGWPGPIESQLERARALVLVLADRGRHEKMIVYRVCACVWLCAKIVSVEVYLAIRAFLGATSAAGARLHDLDGAALSTTQVN